MSHIKQAADTDRATGTVERKAKKPLLKSISSGERLRLRDDVLTHIRPREWVFRRVGDDDTILLVHENGGFGWSVKIDQIDWEAYQKQKVRGGS